MFFIMQVIFKTEESSETLPLNINWMELVYPKHWILWFGREKSMRRQFEEKKSTGHFSFFPLGLWGPLSGSPHHCWDQIRSQQATLPKNFLPLHIILLIILIIVIPELMLIDMMKYCPPPKLRSDLNRLCLWNTITSTGSSDLKHNQNTYIMQSQTHIILNWRCNGVDKARFFNITPSP